MIAAIMCGGKATRMGPSAGFEKPLLIINDRPLVDYAIDASLSSKIFKKVIAITSPNTPKTTNYVQRNPLISCLELDGISYSDDLSFVLNMLKPEKVFVMSSDMPLLNAEIIQDIVRSCQPAIPCTSIVLDELFVKDLGILPSIVFNHDNGSTRLCYSGISIIDTSLLLGTTASILPEQYIIMNKKELAVNINTINDLQIAEKLF